MKKNGIRHVTSAPYHPATNGCAERAVQTFKAALKKMKCSSGETIMTLVNRFLFHYRITPATTTGQSPTELLMGRELKSAIPLLKPDLNRRLRSHHENSIKQSGARVVRNLCIGEPVWVRLYGAGAKWVQGVIVKQTGPVSYHVQTDSHGLLRKHVDQIQTRMEPDIVSNSDNMESVDVPPIQPTEEIQRPDGKWHCQGEIILRQWHCQGKSF